MDKPSFSRRWVLAAVVLIYAAALAVGLSRHEVWLDEAQAWLITCASDSISDLHHRLVWEPHPPLWYYCMYPASRITHSPIGLQVTHWVVSTAMVAVFVWFSPFTLLQKGLFCLGYFPLFEYGVISRNYSLGILLFFVFCVLHRDREKHPHRLYIPLLVMSFAHLFSAILAIAASGGLTLEALLLYQNKPGKLARKELLWRFAWLVFVVVTSFLVFLWSKPPDDMSLAEQTVLGFHPGRVVRVGAEFWKGMIPLPAFWESTFWGSNILPTHSPLLRLVGTLASVCVFIFCTGVLWKRPVALFSLVIGCGTIAAFSYIKANTAIRHFGFFFMFFICCCWLGEQQGDEGVVFPFPVPRRARRLWKVCCHAGDWAWERRMVFVSGLLLIHLVSGAFAFSMDLKRPFSSAKQAAKLIRQSGHGEDAILAEKDLWTSAVAAYLDRPIYYVRSKRDGTYLIWDQARSTPASYRDIASAVNSRLAGNRVVLVLSYTPDFAELAAAGAKFGLQELGSFPGCIHWQYLRVYECVRQADAEVLDRSKAQ